MDVLADHEGSPQPGPAHQGNLQTDVPGHFDLPDQSIPILDDIDNYSTRELRPQRRGIQPTTWLDNDETGDYDPTQERTVKKPRIRLSNRPRPLINHTERFPIEIANLNISLAFTSAKGKQDFSDLISRLHAQDATEEAGYRLRTRAEDEDSDSPIIDSDLTAKPFARGCLECATLSGSGISHCSLLHDERHWPCATCEEDGNECQLIVAPVRKRACETCKRRRLVCSYKYTRNHGVTCSQCASSGVTCVAGPDVQYLKPRIRYDRDWEIDPLPTKKKGKLPANEDCYECSQSGTPCHFSSEVDGSPCEACKVSGNPCTIGQGPPPQSTPSSKSKKRKRELEKETKMVEEEQEKAEAGKTDDAPREKKDAIVKRKKQISVEAKEQDHVQEFPKTLKMPRTCNPHATPIKKQPTPMPPAPSKLPPQPKHRFPAYHPPPKRPKTSSRAVFRKIHTSFCHPMQFNCDAEEEDGAESTDPCHFCTEPTLSFWGLGRVHVEVIDWQDYRPYTEVSKGHKAKGYDSTRLCLACTTDRLEILFCNRHEMVPIPGVQYTDDQMNEAMADLLDGHMRDVDEYCALCGHLAQYQCQTTGGEGGCGLRLCDGCAYTLERKHGCDLQHMLANSYHGPSETAPLGIRADAELLNAKRGPLARFLRSISNEQ